MALTIHHLGISQSERVVWLCEELQVPYKLVKHTRSPLLSPDSLKGIPGNETGQAPFIEDKEAGVTLSESGAICDYIIHRYGNGRLSLPPSDPRYPEYLHWFHEANAALQPAMTLNMWMGITDLPEGAAIKSFAQHRLTGVLQRLDAHLSTHHWLAGEELTAADIMTVYSLTTQRYFGPQISLAPYQHILRYLQDCAARPAYQRAMAISDPEMELLVGAEAPEKSLLVCGGTESEVWRKK